MPTRTLVSTNFGNIVVCVSGDRKKQAIVTFHDLGLNSDSSFQCFFQYSEMAILADKTCIYHLNAPGQEEGASLLNDAYVYPSMDDLAQMILNVVDFFELKTFIGFGIGSGANVLLRFAVSEIPFTITEADRYQMCAMGNCAIHIYYWSSLKYPKKLDGLILVNCTAQTSSWTEWGYQKMNLNYLKSRGVTSFTVDYLMWHHLGKHLDQCNPDMVASYRRYFSQLLNPANLAKFIESYISRSAIPLARNGPTLVCPVLQLVGANSGMVEDTVDLNSKLDPTRTDWMKISQSSGLILEDRPDKVTEAILLFLQGLGYFPALRLVHKRSNSMHLVLRTEDEVSTVSANLSSERQKASSAIIDSTQLAHVTT